MKRIQIYVPGILTWPGDAHNWDGRAVTETHLWTDYRAEKVESLVGPISRVCGQKRRAQKLYELLRQYAKMPEYGQRVLVGHSNGADVILSMFRDCRPMFHVEQLHLVCAATGASFAQNGLNSLLVDRVVGQVFVYVAGRDWALRLANTRPARWLGYGTLGLHGPRHVARAVANRVQVVNAGRWRDFGHSSCWAPAEFEETMAPFLK